MADIKPKKAPLGAVEPKLPPYIEKLEAWPEPNAKWEVHHREKLLTLEHEKAFNQNDRFYVIGSCFAERIRMGLEAEGIKVGPNYKAVPMADDRYKIDTLPGRPHMNYYNSFAIRQEMDRHIGAWTQDPDDYWTLPKDFIWGSDQPIYQDPYRRLVFGRTPDDLREAISHVNAIMDEGIRNADVFFMTMGLTETFVNKKTGLVACQRPAYGGGGGSDETEFRMSTYEENYANMKRTVEVMRQVRPHARIFATVSPVGIARTFIGKDVYVATTENKAILRAVLGALDREMDYVRYFPSYEITMANGPNAFYESDGRHVNPWLVKRLVRAFLDAHYDETPTTA
ncbi:GSCFA domain-containing protein [Brevundimonas sp.]|uniref:GSCFA domain-containing protein n=1 Tax=Brevundimonas sp. TaxID=1871086 RepID=UPI00391C1F5F